MKNMTKKLTDMENRFKNLQHTINRSSIMREKKIILEEKVAHHIPELKKGKCAQIEKAPRIPN